MRHNAVGLICAVLVVGGLLAVTSFNESRRQEELAYRKDLNTACDDRMTAIGRELEANLAALEAMRAYLETTTVDDKHFSELSIRLIRANPSIRSLEWLPKISGSERAQFEANSLGHFIFDGSPIKPHRAPERFLYYPVQYVYPAIQKGAVIGFDANGAPGCRTALNLAQSTNEPALTEKYPVVEKTSDGFGVVAFTPVYRASAGGSTELAGYAAAVIQAADVVERALHGIAARGLDLYVFDESAPLSKQYLYYHPSPVGTKLGPVTAEASLKSPIQEIKSMTTGGRRWTLRFVPTPEDAAASHTARPWALLSIFLTLTGAVVVYLLIHAAHSKRTLGLLSSLEALNRKLGATRDEALEASRLKSQFLANMSHEIRTPMNGILASTELVLGTYLNPEQRELVDACNTSGQQLLTLLNDILDLSRCESGKLTLENIPFNLRTELHRVIQLYVAVARRKRVALNLKWQDGTPDWVRGDSMRLRQVLTNLMSNAIKFTEQGSVTLTVSSIPTSGTASRVRFEVVDSGIGIPTEVLPTLFSPFIQGDGSTTRRYGGTGLGLAICKQLVTLMHGTIEVRSGAGNGATFTVEVDFEAASPVIENGNPERGGISTLRPLKVLLAEDNPVNQLVARRLLERQGCSVDIADTGEAAVQRYVGGTYDLILMDCQMPEMDGYEAARRIRAINRQPRIPIVALTAQAFAGDRTRCLEAGMDDHVSKPINLDQLTAALNRWAPCDAVS